MAHRTTNSILQVLLLAGIAGIAAVPAAADAHEHGKKAPRLVVKSVEPAPGDTKPLHRLLGGDPLEFVATIKNKGDATYKGGVDGETLSRSSLGLSFALEDRVHVPRLVPGDRAGLHIDIWGGIVGSAGEIDTYAPKFCVAPGRRSCAEGPGFAVIPRTWTGTMSTIEPIYGYAKVESDAVPTFTYHAGASQKTRKFVYEGRGDLIHTVSGSNANCSISGGKNSRIGVGESSLTLDPSLLDYYGGITTSDFFFANQTCYGQPSKVAIRTPGIPIARTARSETDRRMQGNGSIPNPSGPITVKWDLHAGD
jgi:hypothetical protein